VVWRWESDPFGATPPDEDADRNGSKFTFNLRFPGQYFDQETGLFHNGFRDYDPQTGRYIQADPIGLAGGLNPYLYAEGNPPKN
jgi:RHS repeat-associated protein